MSSGAERLVLLAIADSARDDGTDAWPSIATISRKANVDTRTAQRAIRRLVGLGELSATMNAGKAGSNLYRVIMAPRQDATPGDTPPRLNATLASGSKTPGTTPPTPRQDATQTVLEPSSIRPSSSADDFAEFWSVYPRRAGKRGAESEYSRAVKRASVAEILAGATRYRDDPNRTAEYTKHPSTWLHQDCWADDPIPARGDRTADRENDSAGWAR